MEKEPENKTEKWREKIKSLKQKTLSFLSTGFKATIITAGLLTGTIETFKKDYPDKLQEPRTPTKIEWSDSTKKMLDSIKKDYLEKIKSNFKNSDIDFDSTFFENRFMNLVQNYGHDIQIIDINGLSDFEKTTREKIIKATGRGKASANYLGNKIYIEFDKGDNPNMNLEHFLAEFAHHINGDNEARRIFKEVSDFMEEFDISKSYETVGGMEHMTHSGVSEIALKKYLFPDLKNETEINYTLPEIYNTLLDNYKQIHLVLDKTKNKNLFHDIVEKSFNRIIEKNNLSEIKTIFPIFLENVKTVLDLYDNHDNQSEITKEIIRICLESDSLIDQTKNFNKIFENSTEISEIINIKQNISFAFREKERNNNTEILVKTIGSFNKQVDSIKNHSEAKILSEIFWFENLLSSETYEKLTNIEIKDQALLGHFLTFYEQVLELNTVYILSRKSGQQLPETDIVLSFVYSSFYDFCNNNKDNFTGDLKFKFERLQNRYRANKMYLFAVDAYNRKNLKDLQDQLTNLKWGNDQVSKDYFREAKKLETKLRQEIDKN